MLGIPNWGDKQLLIRRHKEWVNLWNANCDSPQQRSKQKLLQELELWERTQGGNASSTQNVSNNTASIMSKEFDGSAWSASHNDDFQKLIAQARQKAKASKAAEKTEEPKVVDAAESQPAEPQMSSRDLDNASAEDGVECAIAPQPEVIDLDGNDVRPLDVGENQQAEPQTSFQYPLRAKAEDGPRPSVAPQPEVIDLDLNDVLPLRTTGTG
jgi:E3 ubiquitin-protein ligase RAD18